MEPIVYIDEAQSQALFSQSITKLVSELGSAAKAKFAAGDRQYCWMREIFTDHVIAEISDSADKSQLYSIPWSIEKGEIVFGDKTKVTDVISYVPVSEAELNKLFTVSEAGSFSEAEVDLENRVIKNVAMIKSGKSKNRNLHQEAVMKTNYVQVLEGAVSYFGHQTDHAAKTDPRNIAAIYKNVRFDEATKKVRGDFYFTESALPVITMFKEAFDRGDKDLFGVSVMAKSRSTVLREGGEGGELVRRIDALVRDAQTSCDMVVRPSAGGSLFEATTTEGVEYLDNLDKLTLEELKAARPDLYKAISEAEKPATSTPTPDTEATPSAGTGVIDQKALLEEMKEAIRTEAKEEANKILSEAQFKADVEVKLTNANLPPDMAERVRTNSGGKTLEAVEQDISYFKDLSGKISQGRRSENERIVVLAESSDKMQIALDLMMGVKVKNDLGIKAFKGLQEAYVTYTGDHDIRGQFKLSESFNSASMPIAFGNTLNRSLLQDYREFPQNYRKIATIGRANDFKLQQREKVGYFPDLSDVDPEKADYVETSPFGEEVTSGTVGQKGNLISLTRKAILNDNLNALLKIKSHLARAAHRTLEKGLFVTLMEGNATYTGDSTAFYNSTALASSGHFNLGTAALDQQTCYDGILLMEAQLEPDSGEKIGWTIEQGDLYLIVPPALRQVAMEINQYKPVEGAPNPLFQFFGANNERIMVVPWFTDTNNWYLGFAPEVIDWVEIDFLMGQEEPEFFLQDNPVVGDVFMADKWTYKIRHEYGMWFNDYRGSRRYTVT